MEKKLRKTHDKQFKARVAIEAIREEMTIQQIAQKYQVHPNMVSSWKSQLIEGAQDLFDRANKKSVDNKDESDGKLYRHIGSLTVENEFLKKKYRELYGHEPIL